MKAILQPFVVIVIVLSASASAGAGGTREAGVEAVQQAGGSQEMTLLDPVTPHSVDVDLRDLPPARTWQPGEAVRVVERRRPDVTIEERIAEPIDESTIQRGAPGPLAPSPLVNFAGKGATGVAPPDTVGDVGPVHYIQMVNVVFTIYNKSGAILAGPSNVNSLWSGFGGPCEAQNAGDPIVLYDRLANRWLMSQFASPATECIAISKTGDPVSGGWWLYEFATQSFPDYPKLGVWPDGYYMGSNEGSAAGVYVFEREEMLAGQPARALMTTQAAVSVHSMLLPADLDGAMPPPQGSPNYFYRFIDGDLFGGVDRIEMYEMAVFWGPGMASGSFTGPTNIPTAPFASLCGFSFDCIVQPGTVQLLDSITEWPMWRAQYRNFVTHETLLGNHAVNVGGNQAGVRWFELRKTGGGPWTLYQESTFAPDTQSRWMGSIAMDGSGNIALGYSVSGTVVSPSIRYTARRASDPLGQMLRERALAAGGGVQTGANRWGDYSSLNIDPSDDCTFWFTSEYYTTTSSTGWATRIGSFRLPECEEREMIFVGDEEESREEGR